MIPYKDDNPTRRPPVVTLAIIALNVLVFIMELAGNMQAMAFNYGAIPKAMLTLQSNQPISPVLTVFTAMFLHGGFLHIGGNMLYFWIFGNNIEDKLGHGRFLVFYLLSGVVAAYSNALVDPTSTVPMIGASGAIAGILGAYILLFPRAQVYTVIILIFFIQIVRLPSLIVIGFWIIIQVINGLMASGVTGQHAGVAWFAHIGGFLFGLGMIKVFLKTRRR
ncbi:MAG: rhomboid family intramembrane serine protease [Nitrospirota bacterium]